MFDVVLYNEHGIYGIINCSTFICFFTVSCVLYTCNIKITVDMLCLSRLGTKLFSYVSHCASVEIRFNLGRPDVVAV